MAQVKIEPTAGSGAAGPEDWTDGVAMRFSYGAHRHQPPVYLAD
jgi:hypothetical protein